MPSAISAIVGTYLEIWLGFCLVGSCCLCCCCACSLLLLWLHRRAALVGGLAVAGIDDHGHDNEVRMIVSDGRPSHAKSDL